MSGASPVTARAGYAGAALGLTLAMVGIMLPSSLLTYGAARWGHRNRERREVRAFKQGMTPIVVALLVAVVGGLYLLQLGQSRRHEYEADQLAVALGSSAGMSRCA